MIGCEAIIEGDISFSGMNHESLEAGESTLRVLRFRKFFALFY